MGNNLSEHLAALVGPRRYEPQSPQVAEDVIDIRQSITIQLRNNHYPPVPLSMVEPCVEAIYAVSEGSTHKQINLPEGVYWRGYPTAPAYAIVEGHHLGAWCDYDDRDCDDI